MNELHLERRDHKLDLLKNKHMLDKGYRLYNKENVKLYDRYCEAENPKLTSDLGDDFSRALTRAGIQTTVTSLEPSKLKRHLPYLGMRKLNQPGDVQEIKKVAGWR